jgi:hypothetical protein
LSRGRSEQDEELRLDRLDFRFEPGPARADLLRVRLLVQASFATPHPPEVLDRVRHVDATAIDSGLLQGTVEQLACRPDKGMTLDVFLVARLLADQHELGVLGSLPEDGLRSFAP